jgi:lipoate-protein ligase A
MAVDEVLWRGRRAGTSPPTLRFYAWAPPAVSLGYVGTKDEPEPPPLAVAHR